MRKRLFSLFGIALIGAAVFTQTAYAQEQAGGHGKASRVTAGLGLALSSAEDIKLKNGGLFDAKFDVGGGFGFNVFVDYLLPVGVPVSLGAEFGVHGASFETKGTTLEDTITAIPLLLRAAYHFAPAPKVDLYIVGKLGYVFAAWKGDARDMMEDDFEAKVDDVGGVGFGFDLGAVYSFNERFGLFAELGFDRYALETKIKNSDYDISMTLEAPFTRFLIFGVNAKF
ncbi:MAG: porin family protein [Spirochaetaceae bacterium]|jgi:hypothetical protein|nr:porin family protein [Spirochaetaceae bacterium]